MTHRSLHRETLVKRTTRYTMLLHLLAWTAWTNPASRMVPRVAGHGAEAVRHAIVAKIAALPADLRASLGLDQGSELSQHAQLRTDTGLQVFFCNPHSPWQRGTNENTNRLLRQYFPKGTDLCRYSQAKLDAVTRTLNDRPHKTLEWASPSEALAGLLCAGQDSSVASILEPKQNRAIRESPRNPGRLRLVSGRVAHPGLYCGELPYYGCEPRHQPPPCQPYGWLSGRNPFLGCTPGAVSPRWIGGLCDGARSESA